MSIAFELGVEPANSRNQGFDIGDVAKAVFQPRNDRLHCRHHRLTGLETFGREAKTRVVQFAQVGIPRRGDLDRNGNARHVCASAQRVTRPVQRLGDRVRGAK